MAMMKMMMMAGALLMLARPGRAACTISGQSVWNVLTGSGATCAETCGTNLPCAGADVTGAASTATIDTLAEYTALATSVCPLIAWAPAALADNIVPALVPATPARNVCQEATGTLCTLTNGAAGQYNLCSCTGTLELACQRACTCTDLGQPTAAPTGVPTTTPTGAPTNSQSSSDDSLSGGAIAGILIGSVVGAALIITAIIAAYLCGKGSATENAEKSESNPPSGQY